MGSEAAERIVRLVESAGTAMTVVALDGHGASGKSTIAAEVSGRIAVALVHTDSFFRLPSHSRPPRLEDYYDWERMRSEALEPLRSGRSAVFSEFDWEHSRLGEDTTVCWHPVVLLEGVFSAAPQLADLVDISVLVTAPEQVRLERLRRRISPEEWDSGWLAAEEIYFSSVRPPSSFDLVVSGGSDGTGN